MPTNNRSIHVLRGDASNHGDEVLDYGQPFYDINTNTIKIGQKKGSKISETASVTVDDRAINTKKLDDASVTEAKIAPGTITNASINDNAAIQGSKLADASNDESNPTGVTTDKLENNSVTTAKIENKAITADKLGDDINNKLENDFVTVAGTSQTITGEKIFVTNKPQYKVNSSSTAYDLVDKSQLPIFRSENGNLYIITNN